MSLDQFDGFPLLFGPSPVHPLERLTEHLGGAAIWAKRDDCSSGLAYGANKTRTLECLIADAIAHGCDTLVSIGGVESNDVRQVAAAAARAGMGCVLVQESWVDWRDVVLRQRGNIQLSGIMAADALLWPVKREPGRPSRRRAELVPREQSRMRVEPPPPPAGFGKGALLDQPLRRCRI